MEGKKVIFVEDDNDKENADGVRGHLEIVGIEEIEQNVYDKYIKHALDKILAFGGLVFLSPLFLATALAIKIEDPGPVFFTQKRVGKNKQYFKIHKFRSMRMDTPHDVPTHMLPNPNQYITKVGKFIRAHSIDELPQIWDIFIGNMSVVGPRPALWNQDKLIALRDQYNANNIKPGLTGWAQINGRDELELEEKARLDGEYAKNRSFLMDVKCFLGSIHVFGKDDSVVEGRKSKINKLPEKRHYTDEKSEEEVIGHIGFDDTVIIDREKKVKVLITGANSYIGESFCSYAMDHYKANFTIDTIDMIDGSWVNEDFSTYDMVFHVAGIAHADIGNVSDEEKEKYYCVNTDLAIDVAKKCKEDGVKEFIFMSSMIIYGESAPLGKDKIIDKYTVPEPANFYGDSKLQADVGVRELADEKFKVICLRPPMIYGKGSKGNYVSLAKLAKRVPVFPSVSNTRSILHIDNLCEFLCQLMLIKEFKEESVVLFPQNGEYIRTSDIVKEIGKASGRRIIITKSLYPLVVLASLIPNKISIIVNKAFGSNYYDFELSDYEGIYYRVSDFKESIKKTEI